MHQADVVDHLLRTVSTVNDHVSYCGYLNLRCEAAPTEKTRPQLVVVSRKVITAVGCRYDLW